MKSTDHFKQVIQSYLDEKAVSDTLFAATYRKPNKNIDGCINYILNTVKQSGCNGFTDDEVFGMAIHYYDEESIDNGKAIDCSVIVNHTVELTEEEKKQARLDALQRLQNEVYNTMKRKAVITKHDNNTTNNINQLCLF